MSKTKVSGKIPGVSEPKSDSIHVTSELLRGLFDVPKDEADEVHEHH